MNLSLATLRGAELHTAGVKLRITGTAPGAEQLLVGVRPEHLRVGGEAPREAVRLQANVTAVEPLGAETFVHLDAAGTPLRARMPGFEAPARGDTVPVHFLPRHVHAFASNEPRQRVEVTLEAP
ncbi:MAG: TOBE domain-containing protein [Polyangiaceae bacterium]|nr:TOBE domain-containing protein [Polyangiaceae bacterium]